MFGISGGEFIVILVIAAFVLGPKNVAQAVVGFRKLVEKARTWSASIRKETTVDLAGLGFDSSDVEKLRNLKLSDYDPREMVRQAVHEEMNEWVKATSGAGASARAGMEATAAAFGAGVNAGQNWAQNANPAMQTTGQPSPGPGQQARNPSQSMQENTAGQGQPYAQASPANQPMGVSQPMGPGQPMGTAASTVPNYLAVPTMQEPAAPITNEAQSDGPLDLNTILNRPDLGGSR